MMGKLNYTVVQCEPYTQPRSLGDFDTLEEAVAEMDRLNADGHIMYSYEVMVYRD